MGIDINNHEARHALSQVCSSQQAENKSKSRVYHPVQVLYCITFSGCDKKYISRMPAEMRNSLLLLLVAASSWNCLQSVSAFQTTRHFGSTTTIGSRRPAPSKSFGTHLSMAKEEDYQNKVAELLSNFLPKSDQQAPSPLDDIQFDAPKVSKMSPEALAQALDVELIEKEWFVTGNVNPSYFSDDFKFSDPDVSVDGIEDYARGVYKIFDQETSRAEIISTKVNTEAGVGPYIITCTWRLSGKVSIGPGLSIKPYIVYTDFTVDSTTGLVIFQEDRFSIPGWDIFLSALFPFLIGKVTSEPAPPVEARVVAPPAKKSSPSFWDSLFKK